MYRCLRSCIFAPAWPSFGKGRFGIRRRALLVLCSAFLLSFVVILFLLPDARTRVFQSTNASLVFLNPEESAAGTNVDEKGGGGNDLRPQDTDDSDSMHMHAVQYCSEVHDDEDLVSNRVDILSRMDLYNCSEYRREVVKNMMKWAWDGYAKYAWGDNEVKPVSKGPHKASVFGGSQFGATIVDALDTLYIMDLKNRFEKASKWSTSLSVFETTIRYIGGLLSTFALSHNELFLEKAKVIADLLLPAFNTPTGIPFGYLDVVRKTGRSASWATGGSSILSEFGTLHLEFEYLSYVTKHPVYYEKVKRIRDFLDKIDKVEGMYYNYLNPRTGNWGSKHISLGALGDSFYEYLLKSWLVSNRTDMQAKRMYDDAMKVIRSKLIKRSKGGLLHIVEVKGSRIVPKMDHLACFTGGMFGLDAHYDAAKAEYLKIAEEITFTCHQSYVRSETHLGPEIFRFTDDLEAKTDANDRYYILRPETIESYFYMWRFTKDPKYREWAWDVVLALEKYCKADAGYSGIHDVYTTNPTKNDVQESFFLAETLKYLYLIFSPDDVLPLDRWVFNSEAHPLPVHQRFSETGPAL